MSKITKEDWIKYFPFDEPRKEQIQSINFILEEFKTKDVVLLEGPIGIGKSAIAITVANYFKEINSEDKKSSFILTTQKILQEQYVKDFPSIANISAKQNYQCINKPAGITCDMGLVMAKILSNSTTTYKMYIQTCAYKIAKQKFDNSYISLTNLPFFLSNTNAQMEPRHLLVIDECHNIENAITEFSSLTFTRYFIEDSLKLRWPNVNGMSIEKMMEWVNDVYKMKLSETLIGLKQKIDGVQSESYLESNAGIGNMKKVEEYKKRIEQIEYVISIFNKDCWVMSVNSTMDIVNIKPIYASAFTERMLFSYGEKKLLMSGTILDKKTYCNTIGLKEDRVSFLSVDSPFPVENRLIYEMTIGSMGRKNIDKTLPTLVLAIKEILKQHKNEKGIIHCVHFDSNIKMSDGSEKKISNINKGDLVKSYNEKTGMFENKKVLNVFNNGYKKCIKLIFENSEIICTEDHLILTKNRGWVKAMNLDGNDDIVSEQFQ